MFGQVHGYFLLLNIVYLLTYLGLLILCTIEQLSLRFVRERGYTGEDNYSFPLRLISHITSSGFDVTIQVLKFNLTVKQSKTSKSAKGNQKLGRLEK